MFQIVQEMKLVQIGLKIVKKDKKIAVNMNYHLVWPFHGPFIAFYGLLMAEYRFYWPCVVFSRCHSLVPNKFGRVLRMYVTKIC